MNPAPRRQEAASPVTSLDPVTLAVLNGRLVQIADEMDATLYRSAFNPIIAEAHDACHGLYHAETGATLVQGTSGLPIFVGAMAFAVKAVIDKVARDGDLDRRRHLSLQRSLRRRHPPQRFPPGASADARRPRVRLARLGRALARHRRQRPRQLQSEGDRELPGGRPHPAGEARSAPASSSRTSSTSSPRTPACRNRTGAISTARSTRSTSASAACMRCSTNTATRPSRPRSRRCRRAPRR